MEFRPIEPAQGVLSKKALLFCLSFTLESAESQNIRLEKDGPRVALYLHTQILSLSHLPLTIRELWHPFVKPKGNFVSTFRCSVCYVHPLYLCDEVTKLKLSSCFLQSAIQAEESVGPHVTFAHTFVSRNKIARYGERKSCINLSKSTLFSLTQNLVYKNIEAQMKKK